MESGQQLDWKNLGFGYHPTDYNVRCYYRNGQWGEWEVSSSDMITIPMASTCLHYGQESFEGLKAFRGRMVRYASSALRRTLPACSTPAEAS